VIVTPATEAALVAELSEAWHVKVLVPTLSALRRGLSRRLLEIREIASQEITLGEEGRNNRLADRPGLHLHFMQAAVTGVETFNDFIHDSDGRWALLFDELEIAPDWIREELIRALRGTDERILLKLAFSPYSQEAKVMDSAVGATPGNDYDPISLWYAEKRDGYGFCEHLWAGMLKERGFEDVAARAILGRSYFETPVDEWLPTGSAYGPGSRLGKLFINMARQDPTFRAYLERRQINVRALNKLSGGHRAAEVRKIAPLLAVRQFYRTWDNAGGAASRGRSRKTHTLYAGAESLFAITEGNPRWFIGIVDSLLTGRAAPLRRISENVQARELVKAAHRFAALLRTMPVPREVTDARSSRWLLSIINEIGEYFHDSVVSEAFTAEPPNTFVVDSTADEGLLALLGQALNSGAIVYVPDRAGQVLLSSLRGKRFRLSYLLAPIHHTPLRLGRGISLSSILGRPPDNKQQLDLVGGLE
jgi:hypothetical protein